MEENKKGKGSIITIVILSILVMLLGGYIGYDKFLTNKKCTETSKSETNEKNNIGNTNEKDDNKEILKSESNEKIDVEITKETEECPKCDNNSNKAKCYGTYYINGNKSEGIYTLKEDGTYQVENEEKSGVFVINENTITFIERKHTTGPREEDPIYYNPKSYLIHDDCSKIRLTESGSHTSAYLKKVN